MEAAYGMDEALIDRTTATGRPGLDVYRYPRTAVVIGRGGKAGIELKSDAIARDRTPLLRRRGGGCAVVLDPGNLVLSLALPLPGVGGIRGAFDRISAWMLEILDRSGVPGVERRGVSDLVLGERKIGGSCIWRTRGLLYYSTTILVDPDTDLMDRYLRHPPREPDYRRGRDHRAFTTNLREAGLAGDPETLRRRLEDAARSALPDLIDAFRTKTPASAGMTD